MQMQILEFTDFSGGKTDYFIDAPINKFETADNLLIFKYGQIGRLFTRPGSEIYDPVTYRVPGGIVRIGTLKYFESKLLVHALRKFYYPVVGVSWTTLLGPSSNDVFPSGVGASDYVSMSEWNKHLFITNSAFSKPQKIYPNASNTLVVRTAGMPELASAPTVTAGAAGANTYIYRFHYEYTYLVGTVEYLDRGPTTEVVLASSAAPDSNAVAITVIPAIANGATHNYDTASSNLKVRIARTIASGQAFYYVGSVNNGTTTFNDNVSDATLQTNQELYTEDGTVEVEEPPLAKVVHIVNGVGYWGNIKDGTELLSNQVRQSIPGDPDGVPSDFFVDLDSDVMDISSHRNVPIVACVKGAYRIDGIIDAQGGGDMVAQNISTTASCVSSQSMVQTPAGVFWAGSDGFYFSDGYQCFRVNPGWDVSYQDLLDEDAKKPRIVGRYDSKKNRVYWACCINASVNDNDTLYALDLNWGISNDMPFTSWSGGTNFSPTAMEFVANNLVRGDRRGYILRHEDNLYTDPKIDTTVVDANDWTTRTIMFDFKSAATNFGSSFVRKWVPSMSIVLQDETSVSLQIISNNDRSKRIGNLLPIRFKGNIIWGDVDVIWGDPVIIWNYQGLINQKRHFPKLNLRCDYKQIQLTNALVAIFNSEGYSLGTVDGTVNTCVLDDVTKTWPEVIIDYVIAFQSDNYVTEYTITSRTNTTVTFTDPNGTAQDASGSNWVIRGYPRNEVLSLIGFTIHYSMFGDTQDTFRNAQTGEVGAGD